MPEQCPQPSNAAGTASRGGKSQGVSHVPLRQTGYVSSLEPHTKSCPLQQTYIFSWERIQPIPSVEFQQHSDKSRLVVRPAQLKADTSGEVFRCLAAELECQRVTTNAISPNALKSFTSSLIYTERSQGLGNAC